MRGSLTLSISIIVVIFAVLLSACDNKRIAYVDNTKLYSEFILTKQYDDQLFDIKQKRESELDTIEYNLNILQRKYISTLDEELRAKIKEEHEQLSYVFQLKSDSWNEDFSNLSSEYNSRIWKHLNEYIKIYGKENNYDFILGATGSGNVMYAQPDKNITEQIIDFSNKSFKDE